MGIQKLILNIVLKIERIFLSLLKIKEENNIDFIRISSIEFRLSTYL